MGCKAGRMGSPLALAGGCRALQATPRVASGATREALAITFLVHHAHHHR
jgi:hypothetical protein